MAELRYDITGTSNGLSAAVRSATTNLNTLERSANQTNAALRNDITSIRQLQADIAELNKRKVDIVDQARLARTNALIQELSAELTRAQRAGTVGFDQLGNSLRNANTNIQAATGGIEGFGRGLTRGLGYLRTIAYVLPGIGIAGIFNLAFEAIGGVLNQLDLFNHAISLSKSNLDNLNEVNKDAAKQYGEQSTKLRILYEAATDVNNSQRDRVLAAKELQKEFPSLLKNISTETILNGGASAAYKQLSEDIINNAKAKAAASKISELAGKQLEADLQIQKIEIANINERNRYEAEAFKKTVDAFKFEQKRRGESTKLTQEQLTNLKKVSDASVVYANYESNVKAEASKKAQVAAKEGFEKQIAFLIQYAGGVNNIAKSLATGNSVGDTKAADFNSLVSDQLDSILRKTQEIAGQSGLDSYALQVQKLIDKYKALNVELDTTLEKNKSEFEGGKISKGEFNSNLAKGVVDRQSLANAQYLELLNTGIKETQRVTDEIQRINDAFGVKSQEGREKELAQIKAFYDQELKAARGNKKIIAALDSGRSSAEAATNKKFDDKAAQPFVDFFDKIKNKQKKDAEKDENDLSKVLSRSLRNFGQNFIETLSSVETYSKGTFASIFADLTGQLTQSLNKVFFDVVLNGLSQSLAKAITAGTSRLISPSGKLTGLGAGIAAGGVLGGVISAATPQTSTVGQGAGGALSGAASGAAIGTLFGPGGTVVGAIAGGLIGAIGGIFGASSARKRERELLEQQLEQQKKQTEYLRQQQAAYSSSIVGLMTANGTVTGITRDATGTQLVATLSGKDIIFAIERTKNGR